ncbi:conserved hypothetical protein [Candidatus Terasakiella magnetica]|uniref:L,D-TPase catalytic domain-containing protein n=1 Tax=Candidatus Terasakiella magnetica TaxID=1867952 RepID=A0A1C3RGE3_9PROT|nr:L,D-transpeptidase family protein [Candidatus Terasakiella magnetica]SCA56373.1 conserved hypothetical protein [Candidatus Terasakiella magnetica]
MILQVTGDQTLTFQGKTYKCALGKSGMTQDKCEGDGATPLGTYALRRVLYRADRLEKPETILKTHAIKSYDGWCDAPNHPLYNRPVCLPFSASHEKLSREDHIYDIIVVLGHNDDPPIPGKGSAIFFHLARENYEGTEGCVAIKRADMLDILATVDDTAVIKITK